jgi:hypothetical protein
MPSKAGISRSVMHTSKTYNAQKGRHFTLVEMPTLLYYTFLSTLHIHQTNRAQVFTNQRTTNFGFLNNLKSENCQLWVFEKIHNQRTA